MVDIHNIACIIEYIYAYIHKHKENVSTGFISDFTNSQLNFQITFYCPKTKHISYLQTAAVREATVIILFLFPSRSKIYTGDSWDMHTFCGSSSESEQTA